MVTLIVEGGEAGALRRACRLGFQEFLEKAGLKGRMPRIFPSGSRQHAYDDYCNALRQGQPAMLLVDSEAPVSPACQAGAPADWLPWRHLKARPGDHWDKPADAADTDCHLMAQCMESWLLADRQTLSQYFGQGFRETGLPANPSLEATPKKDVLDGLKAATRNCKPKGQYRKGRDSFKLLRRIDPDEVTRRSPWAQRFVDQLKQKTARAAR